MDIVWLQRDLGLYVVGLFDTHYASRALGYAAGSLAYLLKKFIDFDADKKYQLADWRIRYKLQRKDHRNFTDCCQTITRGDVLLRPVRHPFLTLYLRHDEERIDRQDRRFRSV